MADSTIDSDPGSHWLRWVLLIVLAVGLAAAARQWALAKADAEFENASSAPTNIGTDPTHQPAGAAATVQLVLRRRRPLRAAGVSAASSFFGVSFGLILYQACSTVPSTRR